MSVLVEEKGLDRMLICIKSPESCPLTGLYGIGAFWWFITDFLLLYLEYAILQNILQNLFIWGVEVREDQSVIGRLPV